MLFIILSHYSLETHWGSSIWKGLFFQPFGQIGVDLFVMISGYFLSSHSQSFGKMLYKDIRLWIKVIFYSWFILFVTYIFKPSIINIPRLLRALFPISLNGYWFITSFFVLMLLVPMINDFIIKSNFKAITLIFLVILFTSGVQSILPLGFLPFGKSLNLGIMIAAYFYTSILKKYSLRVNKLLVISLFVIGLLIQYVGMMIFHHKIITNGLAPFLSAMAIFYFTIEFKSFHNSIINWFAKSAFACYLTICNPFSDILLWNVILHTGRYSSHPVVPGLLISLILIIITILFDKIYCLFENKFFSKFFNKVDHFIMQNI